MGLRERQWAGYIILMTYEEFESLPVIAKFGWRIEDAFVDGVKVGAVATNRSEIHILPYAGVKVCMTRKNIQHHLARLLRIYGVATCKYPIDSEDHKIMYVLGFEEVKHDKLYTYWELRKMPFEREHD